MLRKTLPVSDSLCLPSTTGGLRDHRLSPAPELRKPGTSCSFLPKCSQRRLHLHITAADNQKKDAKRIQEWPLTNKSDWATGFPTYLQIQGQQLRDEQFCEDVHDSPLWSERVHRVTEQAVPIAQGIFDSRNFRDTIWDEIREAAEEAASEEPMLSSHMYASVLSHECFEHSLAHVLANRLGSPTLTPPELTTIFADIILSDDQLRLSARADAQAVMARDPSCGSPAQALLYFKGYQAIQAYRISNHLWHHGRREMAYALQSRMSEIFGVDIHPAATIGMGILMDHATGVVIGETAVVGDNVSILHGVTLGGTGKDCGDRHPKVGAGVLIGPYSKILGNIPIGTGSMVAAGSLVLKPVAPHTMVAGAPAKMVGTVRNSVPALTMKQEVKQNFCDFWSEAVAEADATSARRVQVGRVGLSHREPEQQPPAPPQPPQDPSPYPHDDQSYSI